ncbi:MAG: hypothetical protein ACREA3_10610 [Nitrosotalea sp.]
MSKLPVMVFIAAILIASVVVLTVPAANALTPRNWSYGYNDNHITVRYGNTLICGDHMCAPGEWDKLQAALTAAQLGHQGGRTTTTTTSNSTTSAAPTATTQPTTAPSNVCNTINNMLTSAGVSASVVSKVMSDLGCK